jgi:hypothetical protein
VILNEAKVQDRIEAAKIEDEEEELNGEIQKYPYSAHLAKNLLEKNPNLDFMDPNRREKLMEYYLSVQSCSGASNNTKYTNNTISGSII